MWEHFSELLEANTSSCSDDRKAELVKQFMYQVSVADPLHCVPVLTHLIRCRKVYSGWDVINPTLQSSISLDQMTKLLESDGKC